MGTPIELRQGSRAGFDVMLDALTDAFACDPVWGRWVFPDRVAAREQRRALFGMWLDEALEYGCVLATPDAEAVAVWYPPSANRSALDDRQARFEMECLLGADAGRFLRASAQLEAAHPQHRPHFYLSLLGTRPAARGQGLGRRLLEGSVALLDSACMPAYLESTNSINVHLYQEFSFERIGRVQLHGNGPVVDLMWREPPQR